MQRDQIISDLWHCPRLAAAISKMEPADLRDDLRQELFHEICRLPEEKLQDLQTRGKLRTYAIGIIRNMILSNRSAFYNTHRRFGKQVSTDDIELADESQPENIIERIDEAIQALHPYEAGMIRLYAETGRNCLQISKATGIEKKAVYKVVGSAIDKVKTTIRAYAY